MPDFCKFLKNLGINFYCGVPDSLLKDFCAYLLDNLSATEHIIAANEGGAIGLATGYYLATQKLPVVYMQNSGLGNATNPLVSLVDPKIYSIPMLLFIGWRGEPNKKDEPQHLKQGEITLDLLKDMGIAYDILPNSFDSACKIVEDAYKKAKQEQRARAMIVKEGTFLSYVQKSSIKNEYELSREDAIEIIAATIEDTAAIISTTGKCSRELFEYREKNGGDHKKDFLTVGSMGHASQIALGIAQEKRDRQIYCLDGDGAAIMHLGAMAIIGNNAVGNFKHIILNNGAHESVGGQPTVGFSIDFCAIAKNCGYKQAISAKTEQELRVALDFLKNNNGPTLLEVRVKCGARADLGRPTITPQQNKEEFIKYLQEGIPQQQEEFFGIGKLAEILRKNGAKKIFFVHGKESYSMSGAQYLIEPILKDFEATHFFEFDLNPKIEDVKRGVAEFLREKHDIVIGLGGGSAIDMAKAIRVLAAQDQRVAAEEFVTGVKKINNRGVPLVVIPTTAGTGSEATHFAVVYIEKNKNSLNSPFVLPDYFILDPVLIRQLPAKIMASSGMDALCQAIESFWCINSTKESKEYSKKAIELAIDNLEGAYAGDMNARGKMLFAANLAGKAINITQTTACHAISYPITSYFGVAHGHAVALTLSEMLKYNFEISENDVLDSRGAGYVKEMLKELLIILRVNDVESGVYFLKDLMQKLNLPTRLSELNIKSAEDIELIIKNGFNPDRVKNNPRALTEDNLRKILQVIY
ncbi:MAG: phosphonopyruvate decarboxylase [Candidatus Falkowbacteria bacterium]